jgi:hypothetical protein
MNPALTELHATARRNQLLADAERRNLARQARVQRRPRASGPVSRAVLACRLHLGGKRRLVEACVA